MPSTFEIAQELYSRNDFLGAASRLSSIVNDRSPIDHRLLFGVVLARLRRGKEAETWLRGVLDQDPDLFFAITWMSVVSIMNGDLEGSLAFALRAVELQPDDPTAHSTLGDCYLSRRELDKAEAAFKASIALNPNEATSYHNLGLALGLSGKSGEAIKAYVKAIELAPRVPANYLTLSRVMARHSMVGDAIDVLKDGLTMNPGDVQLLSELAGTYALARNPVLAERTYKELLEISPKSRLGYANWLQEEGKFSEARSLYEASIADQVNPGQSHYGLMQVSKLKTDPPRLTRMEEIRGQSGLNIRERMYIQYALGKAYDESKMYEDAARAYDAANAHAFTIYQRGRTFSIPDMRETNDTIFRQFSSLGPVSGSSKTPIFIVGMIRSGTTLLEQIVSSHSRVEPTGELRFWIEEGPRLALREGGVGGEDVARLADQYLAFVSLMAGESEYFTDKMPLNYGLLGLMSAALPNARFLHIKRHPVDTCLSMWMTFFGGGPQFVYDKANVTAYYQEYQRVVERWKTVLPADRLLEVEYENLIHDRKAVVREILEFCGLEWDDACLHHDQNPSTISTPSRWQARQPVYTTSIQKWKNYEPWLGEFGSLLSLKEGSFSR